MSTNETSTENNNVEFSEATVQPPSTDNSVDIELGDVDGDGDLDALVVNYSNQANQLLINDGRGNFSAATTLLPASVNSNDVSLGDVDGDGDLDAFVVNSGQANQLLLNDGNGVFVEASNQLPTDQNYSYAVELGDVDNDGDLDAFVANYWGQANQLFLNDGQGFFSEASISIPGQHYSNDVSLGDLDGDGDLDAFVANYSYQANQVLLNDGQGGFTAAPNQPTGNGSSASVSLGDVDNDGDLDAFVANYNGQANQLLLNAGDGTFSAAAIQPPDTGKSQDASLGDLDGDGDLDIFVAKYGKPSQVLINDGSGVFAEAQAPQNSSANSYGVSLGDLDKDGDLDSFVVNFGQTNQVLLNNGTHYEISGQGVFTAGETGLMSLDYLYDGGAFQGELAVFAVDGLVDLNPGSEAFIQAAAQRALSGSEGYVLIQDGQAAARFSDSVVWEGDFNRGRHEGIQQFSFEAGTQFAIMVVQNGAVSELAENPRLAQQAGKQAIFSMPEANKEAAVKTRLVDFNGQAAAGNGLYGLEDSHKGAVGDRDYNDMVFQIQGATGDVIAAEDAINASRNFTSTAVGQSVLAHANREHMYTEGTFVVGADAVIKVDFLFDGGGFNKGELGIFNLSGMENYTLGSQAFLQEAARRATSASNLGHVVIQDQHQAARFQSELAWERNFNDGAHVGQQTYAMTAGDQFAIILSQNISLAQLAETPALASQFGQQALFSIPEANSNNNLASQIVDLNGLGAQGNGIYGMEDIQVTNGRGDRDYNDLVFQIQGATSVTSTEANFRTGRDWRNLSIGQDILEFGTQAFDQQIQGSQTKDTLTGSVGNDLIEGFKGRDILSGGLGDDLLTGGSGEDTFVLSANAGHDTITDFKHNYDVLGMSDGLTFNDLAFADNDILLKASNDILATLSGFNTTQLTASDFIAI